jgi:hypothetical protein
MWFTSPADLTSHWSTRRRRDVRLTFLLAWVLFLCLGPRAAAAERSSGTFPSESIPAVTTIPAVRQSAADGGVAGRATLSATRDDPTDAPDTTSDDGAGDAVAEPSGELPPPSGVSRLSLAVARLSNLTSHEAPALRGPPVPF